MNIAKSIGTIIAGFLTIVVLSSGTDALLKGIGFLSAKPEDYTS